jgi:hypothetical protein
MVEAIGRQLDRCDVCGKKTHKVDLVRTQVEFLAAAGSNYFTYSSYDTNGWTLVTGTSAGTISSGPYADRMRIVVSDGNTSTESFGTQTWTVGAGFSVYSGNVQIKSAAVDISSWTSFVVAYDFGFYDRETNVANLTPACLIYNTDGATGGTSVNTRLRWSMGGRYWGTMSVSDVDSALDTSAAVFHLTVRTHTGGEKVWIDRMQLIKNATRPGTFVPTSGSTVDRTDTASVTMRKVCPSCRERVLSKTNRYGRGVENRTDDPIAVHNQEF